MRERMVKSVRGLYYIPIKFFSIMLSSCGMMMFRGCVRSLSRESARKHFLQQSRKYYMALSARPSVLVAE